jgi:hypothetical protein
MRSSWVGRRRLRRLRLRVPADVASVQVKVDTSGFAEAFGGSYQGRLRLVALPDGCALSEPTCEPVVLPTSIDLEGDSMTAVVPTGAQDPQIRSRVRAGGGAGGSGAERLLAQVPRRARWRSGGCCGDRGGGQLRGCGDVVGDVGSQW